MPPVLTCHDVTDAFVAALAGGDAAAAAEVYAADARLLAPAADVVEGRPQIEAFWRAGVEAGVTEVRLEELVLERDGSTALEIGRYVLRLHPAGGGAVVERGTYLRVHRRQPDGVWRLAVDVFNPGAPVTRRGIDKEGT